MFKITRNKEKVIIQVKTGYPGKYFVLFEDYGLDFEYTTPDMFYATLVTENIRTKFQKLIIKIREEEYNRGWNDAKKKNRKEKFFKGHLED